MSKPKKKSDDKNYNRIKIINSLRDAFDRIEGEYSGIPVCCLEGYISGRTYMNVRNCLDEKGQKKLLKWNYVPCEQCFKKNKICELKQNGISHRGQMLMALIETFKNEEEQ